ncbi:CTP-dependent riboflavin kinase [Candidatus Woesearchaeota archaeon]|nr:MAG: CTP-dependent riboflavin kinase [Candidatus Woesearchaeota archaeon]
MQLMTPALRILLALTCEEKTSTTALAERVAMSQQSVSRIIAALAKEGIVEKRLGANGLCVCITRKGWRALAELQERISQAINAPGPVLKGTVETGLGEGRYYISRPEYGRALTKLLGREPFPGTLNLHVNLAERERFLVSVPMTEVPGFKAHGRSYGAVRYFPVSVNGRDCGLIIPVRHVHGPQKVELIAPFNLRRAFGLKDGDEVVVERRK